MVENAERGENIVFVRINAMHRIRIEHADQFFFLKKAALKFLQKLTWPYWNIETESREKTEEVPIRP